MAVKVELETRPYAAGELIDYSVVEDATPTVPGDSSGSTGSVSFTARAFVDGPVNRRSGVANGDSFTLTDDTSIENTPVKGRGQVSGIIRKVYVQPGERMNAEADTILNRFNVERTADPYFGTAQAGRTVTSTRTNLFINPSFETALTGTITENTNSGTPTLTRGTDGGAHGPGYARATFNAVATGDGGGLRHVVNLPASDTQMSFTGYYRVNRAALATTADSETMQVQRVQYFMRFWTGPDLTGTRFADITADYVMYNNTWTRFGASVQVPAGAKSVGIYVISRAGTGYATWKVGDTLDADSLLAEVGGVGPYFAGDTAELANAMRAVPTPPVTTRAYSWTGTPYNSSSLETTSITYEASGYDATQGGYFRYLCSLVGLVNVGVDLDFDRRPVAYPGWTGNVWDMVKQFCIAARAEVAMVDDVVVLRKIRTTKIEPSIVSNFALSIDTALSAQYVEIYNYNSRWGNSELMYEAEKTFTVDAGASVTEILTVPSFPTILNNPVCVNQWAEYYPTGPGQYIVTDNQGLRVDSNWWVANGGQIIAETIADEPNKIKLTIFGARSGGGGYLGPFRIGRNVGEIAPALSVTGTGVMVNKEIVRLRTGVSEGQTATIVDSTIDNKFMSDKNLAVSHGLDAVARAHGPIVTMSARITINSKSGQTFGTLTGGRIALGGNIFRITSATYSRTYVDIRGVADATFSDLVDLFSFTFADFNAQYAGYTFAQFNTLMAGKTFAQFNSELANPTFKDFAAAMEGMSFRDHATYPYVRSADGTS